LRRILFSLARSDQKLRWNDSTGYSVTRNVLLRG
jgi:hypothetical protein